MSYKKYLLGLITVGLITIVLLGAPFNQAHAASSFDAISFKPAADQGYYLTVEQSQTLGQWGYAVGLLTQLTKDSVVAFGPTGSKIRDVVGYQLASHVGGAIGLLDWLNAGLLINFVPYQQFNAVLTGASDDNFRMGDIHLNLKGRILDHEKYPLGLALVPFVTFPTGSDTHFTGNGKVTGGAKLVIESPRIADKFSTALNVGAQVRPTAALSSGTTVDDQFLIGLAANFAVIKQLHLIAEINGWTPFGNFFDSNLRNIEANGAIRWFPMNGLALTAGGGSSISDAIGAPDWRIFASLGYRPTVEEIVEEVIRTNKVHFEFDKSRILPESYPVLDEIVETIKSKKVLHVRVEGHTDSKGTDEYNQRLSERRANSVLQYLIKKGIPADKLTAVGMGESVPIASNDTLEGRALNRRVEFHLQLSVRKHVRLIEKDTAPTFLEGQERP